MSFAGAFGMLGALVFFVMVHEGGHFVAARLTGMKVTEFFFGFGPKLWSTKRGETEYGAKAIPAGGYVRITGMNPLEQVDPADIGRTYREKKFWEKSVVVLAGVLLHFVMAYVLLFGMLMAYGVPEFAPEVSKIAADSPAELSGIEVGDRIVEFAGIPIEDWDQLVREIQARPGQTVTFVVLRDGRAVRLSTRLATQHPDGPTSTGYFGIVPPGPILVDVDTLTAVGVSGQELVAMTKTAYGALFNLVRPSSLAQLLGVFADGGESLPDNLRPTSPLGIAQIGSQIGELGVQRTLFILAFLNVFLGVLNGLPIYPLDGGHFVVALYERVTHRRADVRKLAPIAAMVIMLLVFIGLVGLFLDIVNPIDVG
jgi:membrane-associated protease RseP (regulator of RpoE activity)